jgi:hypothetical protein
MSRLGTKAERGSMLERIPSHCDIVFDRRVFDFIAYELERYPNSEEGGKYIGYLDGTSERPSKDGNVRVIITDFLPGGPNAKRTAVEFLPDGDFQEQLFRQAENRDRDVEHLGTWHSHHCNGLDRLSGGDIEGYFKTVNKRAYRPNVFVASLVKTLPRHPYDSGWIDHFLFVRNEDHFYKITSQITIADFPTKFADITGHSTGESQVAEVAGPWHETERGRKVLSEDRQFFADRFGDNVRAVRRDGVIRITCGSSSKRMTVTYPQGPEDQSIQIDVGSTSRALLTIRCDFADRSVAYVASLSALESF